MITFIASLVALFLGYIIYGRIVEKVFGIQEDRVTPAITLQDGVDFVPLPGWKIFMIQFLNISGLGPIFWSNCWSYVWSCSISLDSFGCYCRWWST